MMVHPWHIPPFFDDHENEFRQLITARDQWITEGSEMHCPGNARS